MKTYIGREVGAYTFDTGTRVLTVTGMPHGLALSDMLAVIHPATGRYLYQVGNAGILPSAFSTTGDGATLTVNAGVSMTGISNGDALVVIAVIDPRLGTANFGEASAFNQIAQLAVETAIRDRLIASGPATGTGVIDARTQRVLLATDDAVANRIGTREYAVGSIIRQAYTAASVSVALPTLGASREVYVMSTSRCFFRTGTTGITAAAGTAHPLAADERFHLRIPAGHTHLAVIRDTADGNISLVPVA